MRGWGVEWEEGNEWGGVLRNVLTLILKLLVHKEKRLSFSSNVRTVKPKFLVTLVQHHPCLNNY